jgi:hypothetical protein
MAARRSYPKTALPPTSSTPPGSCVVLITCGGPFDPTRRTYRDNLVVYAVPA